MSSSIQAYARLGGVLFLVSIVAGGFGEAYAPSQVIVPADAAATAHHIVTSGALFRIGFAAYSVEALCDVALAAVLFLLIRPVSFGLAVFFVLFHLMATAVFAFAEAFYFAPAFILGGASYLKSFTSDQLNALAMLSFDVYSFAGTFSQLFYGVASMLFGYLVFRSALLPRILGVLWVAGGVGFAFSAYAEVLAPAYDSMLLRLPTILTIAVTAVWLLAKGIDARRWESGLAERKTVLFA